MKIIIMIIVVSLLVALIVYVCTSSYNKLVINKNKANSTWLLIVKEINIRFNLYSQFCDAVSTTIDTNTVNIFRNSINQYKNKVSITDIIDAYYVTDSINKSILDVVSTPEWVNAFNDSFNRIEVLRKDYNDTILKINNLVKMFPTSLVAKVGGFTAWPFFRGI